MAAKEFLYCYKMTHDTGFAPNPYHGVLTLATCKPKIRKNAKKGYWISGWTSNKVQGKYENKKFNDETQRLMGTSIFNLFLAILPDPASPFNRI